MLEKLNKKHLIRSFNRAANTYDKSAILQREVSDRLLKRFDLINIQPETILDVGCGTGYLTRLLEKRYRKAHIHAIDISEEMMRITKRKAKWLTHQMFSCADTEYLPLASQSVDLICANFVLDWCDNLSLVFKEWYRILKPNGLLMFTSLGPDSLKELRESWSHVDNNIHVHNFLDMHDVGDAMLQAHFSDPVMDREMFELTYENIKKLFLDLKQQGAVNVATQRQRGLIGHSCLEKLTEAYEKYRNQNGKLPVTYEIVYGHAWKVKADFSFSSNETSEVRVPISKITRRK